MNNGARIIFNEGEWDSYKEFCGVPAGLHRPQVPPSFPVLVITNLVPRIYDGVKLAEHNFIEVETLKRMLGLP